MNGSNQLLRRFIQSRPHLSLAIMLGLAVALLLPRSEPLLTRSLIGWNAAVWTYLASMSWIIVRSSHHHVRAIAARQDESAKLVLFTLMIGSVLSLSAIIFELGQIPRLPAGERPMHYGFTALTVLGSWLLVGVLFTFHYAHMFYRERPDGVPLRFPDNVAEPDYWDFLYFSFTIAVAFQTSDVVILRRSMRKVVLAQSVLSFFFNLLILGLSINIAGGVINN